MANGIPIQEQLWREEFKQEFRDEIMHKFKRGTSFDEIKEEYGEEDHCDLDWLKKLSEEFNEKSASGKEICNFCRLANRKVEDQTAPLDTYYGEYIASKTEYIYLRTNFSRCITACKPLPFNYNDWCDLCQKSVNVDKAEFWKRTDKEILDAFNNFYTKPNTGDEQHYVYLLAEANSDGSAHRDFESFKKSIFYVGKGKGGRCFQHLVQAYSSESAEKEVTKSSKIRDSIKKPGLLLYMFHITSKDIEARSVEYFVISGLKGNLTNKRRGTAYGISYFIQNPEHKLKLCDLFLNEAFRARNSPILIKY